MDYQESWYVVIYHLNTLCQMINIGKWQKKAKINYIEEKITPKGKYGVLSLHTSIVRAWPSSYTPIRVAA